MAHGCIFLTEILLLRKSLGQNLPPNSLKESLKIRLYSPILNEWEYTPMGWLSVKWCVSHLRRLLVIHILTVTKTMEDRILDKFKHLDAQTFTTNKQTSVLRESHRHILYGIIPTVSDMYWDWGDLTIMRLIVLESRCCWVAFCVLMGKYWDTEEWSMP